MMSSPTIPEWLVSAYARFARRIETGRVPHAVLICGPAGLGKNQLAMTLAQRLLCQHPDADGYACGECADCRQFRAEAHPDFHLLEPEEAGKPIKIDAVRALCADLELTTRGGRRVAVIRQADAMNLASANALLKTLEEPPPDTVILLVSNRPASLPATIRSRVQRLDITLPSKTTALAWLADQTGQDAASIHQALAAAEGAPYLALQQLTDPEDFDWNALVDAMLHVMQGRTDPLTEAARWTKAPLEKVSIWLYRLIRDLLRVCNNLPPAVLIDRKPALMSLARDMTAEELVAYYDQLIAMRAQASHPLNQELFLEQLFMTLLELGKSHQQRI